MADLWLTSTAFLLSDKLIWRVKMSENNKTKKKINKWLLAAIVVTAILFAALLGVSNYMVNYAIGRSGDGGNRTVALEVDEAASDDEKIIFENQRKQEEANKEFEGRVTDEQVLVVSSDGLNLSANYYANDDSHVWAIVIHGYRGNHSRMMAYIQHYYDEGFQVLAPDLRACGDSEGKFVGMGWPDRKDILNWIDWILNKDPDAQIILHGVSMGAATVLMTSGEETPDEVKAFIEDCGYTSVWDIFASELKLRFKLPTFPVLYSASIVADVRAGYNFKEASSLKQVAQCEKPMMFIHGTLDDFVPFEMLDVLYDAKPGNNKVKLIAEGAGHGEAVYLLGDDYWKNVFDFIYSYLD